MSEQDDWAAFVALMEASKIWYPRTINGVIEYWVTDKLTPFRYYFPSGEFYRNSLQGPMSQVGTWREWLAAGTSPAPF